MQQSALGTYCPGVEQEAVQVECVGGFMEVLSWCTVHAGLGCQMKGAFFITPLDKGRPADCQCHAAWWTPSDLFCQHIFFLLLHLQTHQGLPGVEEWASYKACSIWTALATFAIPACPSHHKRLFWHFVSN